ncbi:MAG: hypothetical protein QM718_00470 [Steroidobacteraceae bacterium]
MKRLMLSMLVLGSCGAVTAQADQPMAADSAPRAKYLLFCGGCHGLDGEGAWEENRIAPLFPRVSAFLNDPEGRRYYLNVGGVSGAGMTDADTAIVLNYVMQSFGRQYLPADFKPYTSAEVTELKKNRVGNAVDLRRAMAARLESKGIAVSDYIWK